MFSPEGVIADEVIRDLVAAEPEGRVVVVVTSDQEVARDASAAGAEERGRGGAGRAAGPDLHSRRAERPTRRRGPVRGGMSVAAGSVTGMTTRIDCDTCVVRGLACHDCVVTVLLGPPPELAFDDDERRALDVLADGAWCRRCGWCSRSTGRR